MDWETGSTLQVTGRAQIGWDTGGSWPGAERLVVVTVDGVLERERVLPQHHYWRIRDGKATYFRGSEDTELTAEVFTA